ncbi:MAG: rhodanese-like domain-containing protein [Gammaproteobacteria bacterium]|nr:rhodanese-like domain-containing protein [Gammaproteobacteria bacterium]
MAKGLMDYVKEAKSQITEISPDDLVKLQQDKADLLVVDVREPGEFMHGHIENALLIPRGVLEPSADLQYPKSNETLREARERPVACYCSTGGRSAMAAKVLEDMGFNEVYSLAGGFTAWEHEGKPVFKEGEY